jgi:hypothetical protein
VAARCYQAFQRGDHSLDSEIGALLYRERDQLIVSFLTAGAEEK